ncbi:MAG TPA: type II toxin-antitoxin system prevent-host-death family antitoxin [Acidisarcina sp.]
MKTVNVHEAKTQLSRLIQMAVQGEPFIIAKAGKPLVKVTALDAPKTVKRIGFLKGQFKEPDDFDTIDAEEIERAFNGEFGRPYVNEE